MSKKAGVVRSVRKKEERNLVYINVYIRVLAEDGSLWAEEIPLRRSRYVDPTAVRLTSFVLMAVARYINSLTTSKL